MTARKTDPAPATNGAAVTEPQLPPGMPGPPIPPPGPPPTDSERITALEQQMGRMAQALAAVLTQQMQPQVQQAILAQLTGNQ